MFLLYNDKIENSVPVSNHIIYKKYLPLSTPRQRLISLITYLLMSAYTIYTCVILNLKAQEISLFVIANIISLASMIFIKAISKSVYELNHQNTYLFVDFVNKSAKLVLFYYAIVKFIQSFDMAQLERVIDLLDIIKEAIINKDTSSIETIKTMFQNDLIPVVSLFVSVLTFIPVLIYFLIINIKMVCIAIIFIAPGINVIAFIYWLTKRSDTFKVYRIKDKDAYYCETRKIDIKGYNLNTFFTKLIASLIVLAFIWVILTFAFDLNPIQLIKDFYQMLLNYIFEILNFLTGYDVEPIILWPNSK